MNMTAQELGFKSRWNLNLCYYMFNVIGGGRADGSLDGKRLPPLTVAAVDLVSFCIDIFKILKNIIISSGSFKGHRAEKPL